MLALRFVLRKVVVSLLLMILTGKWGVVTLMMVMVLGHDDERRVRGS